MKAEAKDYDALFARWLDEVAILSSNTPFDVLERHLDRVTDLDPPDLRFLRKYLAMRVAGAREHPSPTRRQETELESRKLDAAMTRWLDRLDVIGRAAPIEQLRKHLDRAPDLGHPEVVFLAGFVAAREVALLA